MQVKELNKIAIELSNKLDRSRINIIIDMIKCKNKYKASFDEYKLYEFYNLNDEERNTYLTDQINRELIEEYDSSENRIILEDRGIFYNKFKKCLNREFIDLREVSFKDFVNFIKDKDEVICKTINSEDYETLVIDKNKLKNEYNILKIYNNLMKKERYIIDTKINKQSDSLKKVMITTLLNDEVNIINKVIVIDDNYYFIDENGKVKKEKVDLDIPYFSDIILFAKYLAKKINDLKYITFEFLVNEKEIALIDAHLPLKIYQKIYSIDKEKVGLLPSIRKENVYER